MDSFGADYSTWPTTHKLNAKDCGGLCFDGTVRNSQGETNAKIVLNADAKGGKVLGLTIYFPARTSHATAQIEAKRLLTPDATLGSTKNQGDCLTETWRSRDIEDALGDDSSGQPLIPSVSYYAVGDGAYQASAVDKVIIGFQSLNDEPNPC